MKNAKKSLVASSFVFLACFGLAPSSATEMVYYPLNPSFGGSPLNGPVLLNSAEAQNKYTDPSLDRDGGLSGQPGIKEPSALDNFNRMLENSILNRLSASAVNSIIGDDGFKPGTITTGNFTIVVTEIANGMLRITTTDIRTNASTSFDISSSVN